MKLSELESMRLLPRFAEGYEFACKAFDEWMAQRVSFKDALESPWTLEGIAALSEEDLRAAYKIYSTAEYYPDLPRATRNRFLFEQIVNIRKLGTIEAVKALMRYIYPGMSVTIDDTIAFDENGNIIDSSLLHCYDLHLNLDLSQLPEYVMGRVMDNVRRFMRATAALHSISYEAGVEIPIHPVPINDEHAIMSEVVESCKGDVDAWGLYGFTPIGTDDGASGTNVTIAYNIEHMVSDQIPWSTKMAQKFGRAFERVDAAATSALIGSNISVLFTKEEAKKIIGILYNSPAKTESTLKIRDGQYGIYKNAPNITEIEHLYRSDFAVHPTILFVLVHPSRTPYNAGAYTFTRADRLDAPILWKIDDRVAYKGVDFPNGVIFGIKQSSTSLAFGDACKDMLVNYSLDSFLRCQTSATLYANVQYFVLAYYTDQAAATVVTVWRSSDNAQFRAYTTPDNYYFILDENYETNTWIPESELAQHGYYI